MSEEEEDGAIREMGKIEVVLQRGHTTSKRKRDRTNSFKPDSCTRPDEVTKKVSHKNGKSLLTTYVPLPLYNEQALIVCRLVPLHAADESGDSELFWTPGKGEAKKKIRFVFLYTTTRKCCPYVCSTHIADKPQSTSNTKRSFRSSRGPG